MSYVETSLTDELDDELPPEDEEGLEEAAPAPRGRNYEAEARAMGWHPLSEYRGPAHKWVDAKTFVQRGETELPVLRDNMRRMHAKMEGLTAQNEELARTVREQNAKIDELIETARTASRAGYERALADLKAQRRDAIQSGDADVVDQLDEQIDALKSNRRPGEPPPGPAISSARADPEPRRTAAEEPPPPPQVDPAVTAFTQRESAWFGKDADLTKSMIGFHQVAMAENPEMSMAESLEEALDMLKERYPHRFGGEAPQPRRAQAAAPDADEDLEDEMEPPAPAPRAARPQPRVSARSGATAVSTPARGTGRDPWANIEAAERADAKRAYERERANDPGLTAAEYVYLYNNPHADVLQVQRRFRRKA